MRKYCLDGDGDDDDTFLKKREDTNYNICFANVLEKTLMSIHIYGFFGRYVSTDIQLLISLTSQ